MAVAGGSRESHRSAVREALRQEQQERPRRRGGDLRGDGAPWYAFRGEQERGSAGCGLTVRPHARARGPTHWSRMRRFPSRSQKTCSPRTWRCSRRVSSVCWLRGTSRARPDFGVPPTPRVTKLSKVPIHPSQSSDGHLTRRSKRVVCRRSSRMSGPRKSPKKNRTRTISSKSACQRRWTNRSRV
jgi:hypothetical protein